MLNPDVRMAPGSVAPLLEALRKPGIGIVAPQLRSADGTLEPSLRRNPTLLRALGLERTGLAVLAEKVHDAGAVRASAPGGLGPGRGRADVPGVL